MSGWASVSNSIKNQSKLASMRAQIDKLKGEDLRAAHHSLGEKCFNSGLFTDQLSKQHHVIRELDAMIAEKREPEEFEIGETKMATLKRLGKNVVHSSQAQAMLLKRQGLLTELGKAVNLLQESEGLPGIATEKDILKGVEAQIRMIEERIAEQADMESQTSSAAHQDSPSKSDSSDRGSSSAVANGGGISAIFWKLRNLVIKKIAIASCIILGLVMIIPFCGESEPEEYDVGEAMLEDAREIQRSYEGSSRSNSGSPCSTCNGQGKMKSALCTACNHRGTVRTPSGYDIICSKCQGNGREWTSCAACGGSGAR